MKDKLLFLNTTTSFAAITILLLSLIRLFKPHLLDGYFEVFLLVLFFILLYQLNKIKKSLLEKSEVQKMLLLKTDELEYMVSSFDKHIIFSKTDLNGVITNVSKAFCEVSGYEAHELIGQPHNIIRHPDMSKEAFKDLWETIKLGLTWYGEVKNRKKNGDSYWGFSKVAPEYNSKNEHIGYYAIRQNITAQKEVEELKDELENINSGLEQQFNERVLEITHLNKEIQETQKEVVFTMGAIGERRSKETGNHVKRVAEYSKLLALNYGFSKDDAELLKQASPMHDIGKIGIPDAILNKPGIFDEAEKKGLGVVSLGSKMIDPPVVKRALHTIDLAIASNLLNPDWKN